MAYLLLVAGLAAKVGWAPVHHWLPHEIPRRGVSQVAFHQQRHGGLETPHLEGVLGARRDHGTGGGRADLIGRAEWNFLTCWLRAAEKTAALFLAVFPRFFSVSCR